MTLFVGTLIAGLAVGLLYGLLGFSIVVLHKATGVANFAQGSLATLAAFLVYALTSSAGLGLWPALLVAALAMVLVGCLLYLVVLRPRDDAGQLNITTRTLAVFLLVGGLTNAVWPNQPMRIPSPFPDHVAFSVSGVAISWLTLGTVLVAAALAAACGYVFWRTRLGLIFLATAERPEIAQLLGVRTRRLSMLAWAFASFVALVVGVLIAPSTLVSSDMMDLFLLFGFAAGVVGGLSSLGGVFVGGLLVGVANSLSTVYSSSALGAIVIFALVMVTLLFRPQGLFGRPSLERL
jgi:branched-chain amino acid transport system permease protein